VADALMDGECDYAISQLAVRSVLVTSKVTWAEGGMAMWRILACARTKLNHSGKCQMHGDHNNGNATSSHYSPQHRAGTATGVQQNT
jgi:hypothetical protein